MEYYFNIVAKGLLFPLMLLYVAFLFKNSSIEKRFTPKNIDIFKGIDRLIVSTSILLYLMWISVLFVFDIDVGIYFLFLGLILHVIVMFFAKKLHIFINKYVCINKFNSNQIFGAIVIKSFDMILLVIIFGAFVKFTDMGLLKTKDTINYYLIISIAMFSLITIMYFIYLFQANRIFYKIFGPEYLYKVVINNGKRILYVDEIVEKKDAYLLIRKYDPKVSKRLHIVRKEIVDEIIVKEKKR